LPEPIPASYACVVLTRKVYCLHCNGLILVAFGEEHVAGQRTCIHCGAHNVFSSEDAAQQRLTLPKDHECWACVPDRLLIAV